MSSQSERHFLIIAGDIGGTKTQLAVFSSGSDIRRALVEKTYASGQFPNLHTLASVFLDDKTVSAIVHSTGLKIEKAVFGAAGPVVRGRVNLTNLDWDILDEDDLARRLNISRVKILNDIEAAGYGILVLTPADLFALHPGQPSPKHNMAMLAPGTGLGEGFLTPDSSGRYIAHGTEGGHTDFAPNSLLEIDLLKYLFKRFEHVSYERIGSGIGLLNIYRFLRDEKIYDEPAWLNAAIAESDDPNPVIVHHGQDTDPACEICLKTLTLFTSILGAEAGNLALKTKAAGGVFLTGGIPPRILPTLQKGAFMKAFLDKGRMADVLSRIPVHVVLKKNIALVGAANYGREYLD